MGKFSRAGMVSGSVLVSLVSLLFAVVPSATPQENLPIRQVTVLTFVHDFLQVFYPELISKGHTLKLSVHHPADASWSEIAGVYFTVNPERPPDYGLIVYGPNGPILETRPDPESVLLDGSMWIPPLEHGSRIQEVNASSAGERKLEALRKTIQSHPEWSDDQAVSALKKDGARFGPEEKNAFISTLPFDKTERFFGRLKITSVDFSHLQERRSEHPAVTALDWIVSADALFSDGTSAKYIFGFEPYDGKLAFLARIP
jgi:hypothetical protein